jgi:hypothetical protein
MSRRPPPAILRLLMRRARHEAGRLQQAESLYHQILASQARRTFSD